MTTPKVYSKWVVARHSPKNGCDATEGAVLIVEPRKSVPSKTVVQHTFVNVADRKEKSKYGWVAETTPFTLDEFVSKHLTGVPSEEEIDHVRVMMDAAQTQPEGTPLTADYKSRGVIERSMQLTVHKVVFYKA